MARNGELISLRDRKIIERWYYWTEIRRVRLDDALSILSEKEFFTSQFVLLKIIRELIRRGVEVEGKKVPKPIFHIYRERTGKYKKRTKKDAP